MAEHVDVLIVGGGAVGHAMALQLGRAGISTLLVERRGGRSTHPKALENTFEMIKAETQLMFSSDWPHFDFDLPQEICDLPFLGEQAKRNILGLNAARIFNLDPTPVKKLIVP